MRRLLIILTLICSIVTPTIEAAPPRWETVEVPDRSDIEHIDSDTLDITVRNGYVYITTTRSVTVKVFTILGQLISQETVAPGTHRLKITSRGIYILKAGSATRRITL